MIRFFRRLRIRSQLKALKQRAEVDPYPRSYIELCRKALKQGDLDYALKAARLGLERFPHCEDLRDVVRHTWRQTRSKEIDILRRRCESEGNPVDFAQLADVYIDCEEYDEALAVSEELLRRLPAALEGPLLSAKILLKRFYKDHVAGDAKRAIVLLKRVLETDEAGFQANFLLAEVYRYIGAISKALFHVYRALDADRDNREAKNLYEILINLPLEKSEENALLRGVEENESSFAADGNARRQEGSLSHKRRTALMKDLGRLSQLNGVTRSAFVNDEVTVVARNGESRQLGDGEVDRLCDFACGFRSAAAMSAKRMGIGAFQSSVLRAGKNTLQFHAAGRTVILVESDNSSRDDVIKQECLNFVASCSRKTKELVDA